MVETEGSQELQGKLSPPGLTSDHSRLQAIREAASSTAKALTVENVAGAFLVLIIGMTLASITAIMEFLWDSRRILTNENVIFRICNDVRLILSCSPTKLYN